MHSIGKCYFLHIFLLKLLWVFISTSRLLPYHVAGFSCNKKNILVSVTLNLQKLALGVRGNGIKTNFFCLKIDVSYFVYEQRQKFHIKIFLYYTF